MKNKLRYIYDIETYPSIFSITFYREDGKHTRIYEISDRKNDSQELIKALRYFSVNKIELVGFNNISFDYPIIHKMMQDVINFKNAGGDVAEWNWGYEALYRLAQTQIESFKDGFGHTIRERECLIPQIDLFKIHHFDNKAKSTSLKLLEFNMRSESVEDLPFPVGSYLDDDQKDILLKYNLHDVLQTFKFYKISKKAIDFRASLTEKMQINVMNFNDTKIGKEYFIQKLEETNPGVCYTVSHSGSRTANQTRRKQVVLKDCLFEYYDFKRPEFQAVFDWFGRQVITETKGVFSNLEEHTLGEVAKYAFMEEKREKFAGEFTEECFDSYLNDYPLARLEVVTLKQKMKGSKEFKKSYWAHRKVAPTLNVVIDSFQFDFGVGGIHGSISKQIVAEDEEYEIVDADVSSMYPNIAIVNKIYPKHLGVEFCTIYEDVYKQRQSFAKGTAENAVMKLALNGVYGDSNNQYSPFYDPMYTMCVTVNGQLSICLLCERFMQIEDLKIIAVNTDGVTVKLKRKDRERYMQICKQWESDVGLQLEYAYYSKMFIRDVNSYIALYTDGKVKRKGAYQYEDLGYHQDQSALVIRKAAEANMLKGIPLDTFIKAHADDYDFCLRTKVDRSSRLVLSYEDGREEQQQNICRYYPCKYGGSLFKIMKELREGSGERRMGLDLGYKVKTCNNMQDFDRLELDYSYYVDEARKLLIEG